MQQQHKQQKTGAIYKVGAFLAFIMLGSLGLRGYGDAMERARTNGCMEEIMTLSSNIQAFYLNQRDYGEISYKLMEKMKIFPDMMRRAGYSEPTNSYLGGVDIWYSSLNENNSQGAFEISFQGLSRYGCMSLVRMQWDSSKTNTLIAVAGYPNPMPAGVLDNIYTSTRQEEIKGINIFRSEDAPWAKTDKLKRACNCSKDTCSVVWKFS